MSKRIPSCDVCGSSAPVTRSRNAYAANGGRQNLNLCYHDEFVCWDHLLDPCPECDAA